MIDDKNKKMNTIMLSYEHKNYIKEEINSWDPVDLLSAHAPSDEYDIEINDIFNSLLMQEIDYNILADTMFSVFEKFFGGSCHAPKTEFYKIAKIIIKRIAAEKKDVLT